MAWPQLFLAGAEKAGTTSLHAVLDRHPEIAMCDPKEPHYYSWKLDRVERGGLDAAETRAWYAGLFSEARWPGDASTSGLWHPKAAGRIHADAPDARIVAAFRDPVERAFSHHLMAVRSGREHLPFRAAVEADQEREQAGRPPRRYVLSGRYGSQWGRYVDAFGKRRCQPVWFEQVVRDTPAAMAPVAALLDVDPDGFQADAGAPKANPYWGPRNAASRAIVMSKGLRGAARQVLPMRVRRFVGDRILMGRGKRPVLAEADGRWLADLLADEVDALWSITGRPPVAWKWYP